MKPTMTQAGLPNGALVWEETTALRRVPLEQGRQRYAHRCVNRVALKPPVGAELRVAAQVGVYRHTPNGEIIADLWADAACSRLVWAEDCELSMVSSQLLVIVSHGTDEKVL